MAARIIPDKDIYYLAVAAGFKDQAVTMTAIALGESGGNANAHNPIPPDDSYGLTQVNMIGGMGPARRAKYGLKSNEDLYNPATNLRVAYGIYKDAGNSFRPWSVYLSGRYLGYMPRARAAASGFSAPLVGGTLAKYGIVNQGSGSTDWIPDLPNPLNPVNDAIDAFKFLTSPGTWLRVAAFVGGGLLLMLVIIGLIAGSRPVTNVVGMVPGAGGAVAKAARTVAK